MIFSLFGRYYYLLIFDHKGLITRYFCCYWGYMRDEMILLKTKTTLFIFSRHIIMLFLRCLLLIAYEYAAIRPQEALERAS